MYVITESFTDKYRKKEELNQSKNSYISRLFFWQEFVFLIQINNEFLINK